VTSGFSGYWFKTPDEIDLLMALKPAELRVYLVVLHAIQRDRNGGLLSMCQIASRANISRQHAVLAVESLCQQRFLLRVNRATGVELTRPQDWQRRTVKYDVPIQWKQRDSANWTPTGDQNPIQYKQEDTGNWTPTGDQQHTSIPTADSHLTQCKQVDTKNWTPTSDQMQKSKPGDQNWTPTGDQFAKIWTPTGDQHLEEREELREESPGDVPSSPALPAESEIYNSSSSSRNLDIVEESKPNESKHNNDDEFIDKLLSENQNPMEELFDFFREGLRRARAKDLGVKLTDIPRPDVVITKRILRAFSYPGELPDPDDFLEWLGDTMNRQLAHRANSGSWGIYLEDAKNHRATDYRRDREAREKQIRERHQQQAEFMNGTTLPKKGPTSAPPLDLRTRLVDTCRKLHLDYTGDALEDPRTTITESADLIRIEVPSRHRAWNLDYALQALASIGDNRRLEMVPQSDHYAASE
jgi:hypothetical protein